MPTVDCEAPNWEAALLNRTDELYVEEDERLRLMREQIEAHRRDFFEPEALGYLHTCLITGHAPSVGAAGS